MIDFGNQDFFEGIDTIWLVWYIGSVIISDYQKYSYIYDQRL